MELFSRYLHIYKILREKADSDFYLIGIIWDSNKKKENQECAKILSNEFL